MEKKLLLGNNLEKLRELEDNSIDSIVSDPPYGLSFMNKKWDYDVPSVAFWKEVYRVLKPGGHILSFGGTRTYHRMVVNIEDAGFEIRDCIQWLYGSGFPKSHNIGKAIDARNGKSVGWFGEWLVKWRKENNIPQSKISELFPSKTGGLTGCVSNWEIGKNLPTNEQFNLICKTFNLPFNSLEEAEREFIGYKTSGIGKAFTKDGWASCKDVVEITKGNSQSEREFIGYKRSGIRKAFIKDGWGSRKDVVEITKGNSQYEGWGTALKPANEPIVMARKPLEESTVAENVLKYGTGGINIDDSRIGNEVIPIKIINNNKNMYFNYTNDGNGKLGGIIEESAGRFPANIILDETAAEELDKQSGISKSSESGYEDTGGASRFFYIAKVSKKERNLGLKSYSTHPTVKPTQLMSYLCKLITPPNGTILDPYMGSGSTGIAALLNGFNFVGMEMEEEYFNIASLRIDNYEEYRQFLK